MIIGYLKNVKDLYKKNILNGTFLTFFYRNLFISNHFVSLKSSDTIKEFYFLLVLNPFNENLEIHNLNNHFNLQVCLSAVYLSHF